MEIIPEHNPQYLLKCFLVVLKEPRESIKRLRKKGNFYLFIYWLKGVRGAEVGKDSLMALPGKGRYTRLALKTMEQSFVYGEIYWSTWRLLAISMSTVLVELSEQELSPLTGDKESSVGNSSPPDLTQREREREVPAAEFPNNCNQPNAMQVALSIPFSDHVLARIKKYC